MTEQNKSICIFIHFSEQQYIPYYVQVFVNELARFFDEVVLLSNQKTLKSLPALRKNVVITFQENIGYDFGRFYNYYKTIDTDNYSRIACVNDSNVLINNLDNVLKWENIAPFDFWGLVDSYEKPWFSKHLNNHHKQSHFLIFHKKSIELLDEYFSSVNVEAFFEEKDSKILRRNVIDKWEIVLSQFMISKELEIGHFYDSKKITTQFNIRPDSNISHSLYEELLTTGYPFIKKKVIVEQKSFFGKNSLTWKKLIKKHGNPKWKLDTMIEELDLMKKDYSENDRSIFVNKLIIYLQQIFIKPGEN